MSDVAGDPAHATSVDHAGADRSQLCGAPLSQRSLPVIVTARMTSHRFPGKSLAALAGVPVLERVIMRVRISGAPVVLATSDDPSDDRLAQAGRALGVVVHRGPLDDVAARVLGAARAAGAEAGFVRISGDSPLLDPALIAHALALWQAGDWDVVTNVRPRTFPRGQSVEVIRTGAFAALLTGGGLSRLDREHVTPALYRTLPPQRCHVFTVADTPMSTGVAADFGEVNLCVDEPRDCARLTTVIERVAKSDAGTVPTWWDYATAALSVDRERLDAR